MCFFCSVFDVYGVVLRSDLDILFSGNFGADKDGEAFKNNKKLILNIIFYKKLDIS